MASSSPPRDMRVLVGATGGIAVVKTPQVISGLKRAGCDVRVVMTPAAARFVAPLTFESLTANPVGLDMFTRDHPAEIQHVSWAKWAQAALIVPASANTIGKLACGIADNLLTSMLMAATCPVALCPSMNTHMLLNPATQRNLETLRERGMRIIEPASGHLACGDEGKGRLPDPEDIVREFLSFACPARLLEGKRVLVTAGPTQEPIDPVRYLSNRSSGKMGYALAQAAIDEGALVTLVTGPVDLRPPDGCETMPVQTAVEMEQAVLSRAAGQDIIIGCAAVSDYRPARTFERKLKKAEAITIDLVENPDILAELGGMDHSFYLAGFAAETNDVEAYATQKLERKHLDMIVANDVSRPDIAFGAEDNAVTVFRPGKPPASLAKAPKRDIARQIIRLVARDLEARV